MLYVVLIMLLESGSQTTQQDSNRLRETLEALKWTFFPHPKKITKMSTKNIDLSSKSGKILEKN